MPGKITKRALKTVKRGKTKGKGKLTPKKRVIIIRPKRRLV